MRETPLAVLVVACFVAAACGETLTAAPDGGLSSTDGRAIDVGADGTQTGILVDYPALAHCDHGLVLDPSRPEIAMYVWSSDLGCAEGMSGTRLGEIAEISILVRGARRGEVDFPPVAMAYPIGRSPDPDTILLEPDTAGIQSNLAPAGSVRAESGVVIIEAIDADSVTFTVDALLEDGTSVRGRMTVGRACR